MRCPFCPKGKTEGCLLEQYPRFDFCEAEQRKCVREDTQRVARLATGPAQTPAQQAFDTWRIYTGKDRCFCMMPEAGVVVSSGTKNLGKAIRFFREHPECGPVMLERQARFETAATGAK